MSYCEEDATWGMLSGPERIFMGMMLGIMLFSLHFLHLLHLKLGILVLYPIRIKGLDKLLK